LAEILEIFFEQKFIKTKIIFVKLIKNKKQKMSIFLIVLFLENKFLFFFKDVFLKKIIYFLNKKISIFLKYQK
jgi:hypothetical protein